MFNNSYIVSYRWQPNATNQEQIRNLVARKTGISAVHLNIIVEMEKIKPVTKNWEDWKNSKNTAALVKKVKHKLNSMRKKSAKRRPLGIAGINWYGCELFFRLVGVMGNSIPCREGMDFVVQYICKPICEKDQCQLVDLFDGIMINGTSVVAEMNCFHSYTWKQPLQVSVSNVFLLD